MKYRKKIWSVLRYFYHRFAKEGCSYRAAALAYTTLLSVVPLVIIGFGVLSLIPYFSGVGKEIEHFVLSNFVAESATAIAQQINYFLQNVHRLSIFNLIFLAIIALILMYNINRAFNTIWHAERHFHFTLSFVVYTLVLLLSPIIVGGFVLLGTSLSKTAFIIAVMQLPYIEKPLSFLSPHVLTFVIFTILNWVLPSCRVRLFHAVVGGLISTVLFELAKYGFTVYLTHFPTYRLLYGALAVIPIFLIWLYVSWLTILLGALTANIMATGIPRNYKLE